VKKKKNSSIERSSVLSEIDIKGARVHNLKNVDVSIPRNQFTVITGLSGSGKSSLAFDTLYAEGQRRYVESLSSYARQFLGRLDKPDVDSITGISPAVAIEQKVTSRTSRSTVGTTTEIYDYLKLLFARVGKTYSPISGMEVKRHRVQDVVDWILSQDEEDRLLILAPIAVTLDLKNKLQLLHQQGYARVMCDRNVLLLEEVIAGQLPKGKEWFIVVDRVTASRDEDNLSRLSDSVQSAFYEGKGSCFVYTMSDASLIPFSNRFELDGITFEEPSVHFFTFNNPVGACKTCEGFGSIIGIDPDLVIPNPKLSVYQDGIVCWRGETMSEWKNELIYHAAKFKFPIHKPIGELTKDQYNLLWSGNAHFGGLNAFFKYLESETYKIQYRVMLSRYRGKTTCTDCQGTRLRKDASYVRVGGKCITDLVTCSIETSSRFFEEITLDAHQEKIAKRLLLEIRSRLKYLMDVGLGYLTLNRLSNTLSGGESQRIHLATSLGSALVGSMYILDEPSIGLHPRDTERLIGVLKELRNQGNTVLVVEHDEEVMRAADHLIDMGPNAGILGGHVVATGSISEVMASDGWTAAYLTGREKVAMPSKRAISEDHVKVLGAREHTLKNVDVRFPLRCFTAVSGVSGSGKSTLIRNILFPGIQKELGLIPTEQVGKYTAIEGDLKSIDSVEFVDQNPIGKSSRSNPVTYIKAYDDIRAIYVAQHLSKQRGYKPAYFSFNVEGGRCESCEGEGMQTISMQFMADVKLVCDACKGRRFKDEVLEVEYRGLSIDAVLKLTVDEAVAFFSEDTSTSARHVVDRLKPLQQVGLGYVGLGQSSSTLSGGEAQRIKLASYLSKGYTSKHTLFIFDEPTTGLHFHDVRKLMESFQALLQKGHSIIAIEHHVDVLKSADWLIDMGPEGGDGGGQVVYEGPPSKIPRDTYTGRYIRHHLK
jgi:excinuclease ABC subunit A